MEKEIKKEVNPEYKILRVFGTKPIEKILQEMLLSKNKNYKI